jgi:molecular chaperone HtpG
MYSDEEKKQLDDTRKSISEQETKKSEVISSYAAGNDKVHQIIDLALLQNGMLKGEALTRFVKRSVEMIK